MAGQARSRGTRGPGRSSAGDPSWPVLAGASAAVSGSSTGTARRPKTPAPAQTPKSFDPATRSTYRLLLMRGLAPAEAANLTAFLSGIHVGEQHWRLNEVNTLLFLRELNRSGRFGNADGEAPAA
jgi:hypothetical protein